MTLYLVIGNAVSDGCTVRVSARSFKPIIVNDFIIAHEQTISFEGYLYAIGPMALSARMLALENAVAVPNQSVGLSTEFGSTQHWLSATGAIGGIKITDFGFEDTPLHMATQVKYRLSATAIYSASSRSLLELNETVTTVGEGGAKTVLASQAGLQSIYQTVKDYTDVQVVQSGKVVGRTMPSIPSPIIGTSGARDVEQTRDSVSYTNRGTSILLINREYSYTFNLPAHPGAISPTYLT